MRVSVCIPTKNGEATIKQCLEALFKQKYVEYEVNIIDSGSSDSTCDIVKTYPVNLSEIKPQEFEHGKTRNHMAKNADCDIVVFLCQDAIPVNDYWLKSLINPIVSGEVVGTSGKQTPRINSTTIENHFCRWRFPGKEVIYDYQTEFTLDEILFSTVSCAIRKETLLKNPFVENTLIQGQDKLWATQTILKGYKIAYIPESMVEHSHPPYLKATFKEYFDRGISRSQILKNNLVIKEYVKSNNKNMFSGFKFLGNLVTYFRQKGRKRQIPGALLYYLIIFIGLSMGKRFEWLPGRVVAKLSKHHMLMTK